MMRHKTLFSRRLLFVTGKGGVGKTTIAASMAVAARDRGMKTLLIEVGSTENLPQLFRKWIPAYDITRIEDGLHVLRLDPYLALQDYFAINFKFEWAAKKFLQTDVIRYLTQAAPGWRELITLGKIWKLEQERADRGPSRLAWDILIVDAPATGHGISFLRVPQVILDTLKYGPVRHYTQEVQRLLLDPHRTLLNVVTLPEEMPMNEAVEIHAAAKNKLLIPFGFVFVNMMPKKIFTAAQEAQADKLLQDPKALEKLDRIFPAERSRLFEAAAEQMERRRNAEAFVEDAAKKINAEFVELPYLYQDRFDRSGLDRLARIISESAD